MDHYTKIHSNQVFQDCHTYELSVFIEKCLGLNFLDMARNI